MIFGRGCGEGGEGAAEEAGSDEGAEAADRV